MNDNRCEKSGQRIWGYGTPVDDNHELFPCPNCGRKVLMTVSSGRLAVHDVIVAAAA